MNLIEIIAEDAWADPITEEHEANLIAKAKDGDHEATMALIVQYLPLIKRSVNAPGGHDKEDAAQEVLVTILETIKSHDTAKSPRLAGRLSSSLSGAVREAGRETQTHFSVPSGTLKRYNTILRAAEGNVNKAMNLCKQYRMKDSTFLHIHNLINNVAAVEEVTHFPSPGVDEDLVCDSLLCEYALSILDDEQVEVIRYAYGFTDLQVEGHFILPEGHNPLSASIVSAAIGISTHRVKTLQAKSLQAMRDHLGEREVA